MKKGWLKLLKSEMDFKFVYINLNILVSEREFVLFHEKHFATFMYRF